jgi:hypothetical protein
MNSPLSFQEGFWNDFPFLKWIPIENFHTNEIPIEIFYTNEIPIENWLKRYQLKIKPLENSFWG